MAFDITAQSTPVYDDWGWGDYWQCSDWITWHKKLKQAYKLEEANRIFIDAYGKAGFLAASYNCRSLDTSFKNYAKDNGFYESLFPGISGAASKTISSGQSLLSGGTSAIESVSSTIKNIAPWVIVIIAGLLIWYVYKRVK